MTIRDLLVVFLFLLVGATCAATKKSPNRDPSPGDTAGRPLGQPVEGPPTAADDQDACAPVRLLGRWLIASGTAATECDSGYQASIAAGGTVELEQKGEALLLKDGACHYGLSRKACVFTGSAVNTCVHEGLAYDLRELVFSIEVDALGVQHARMVYSQSHTDRREKKGMCRDTTQARLVRGAPSGARCLIDGRWRSPVTSEGEAGEVLLEIAGGTCTITAPAYKGVHRCAIEGGKLVWKDAGADGVCRGAGRYGVSFADGCAGLVLESDDEPCASRAAAIDYLYLQRARGDL